MVEELVIIAGSIIAVVVGLWFFFDVISLFKEIWFELTIDELITADFSCCFFVAIKLVKDKHNGGDCGEWWTEFVGLLSCFFIESKELLWTECECKCELPVLLIEEVTTGDSFFAFLVFCDCIDWFNDDSFCFFKFSIKLFKVDDDEDGDWSEGLVCLELVGRILNDGCCLFGAFDSGNKPRCLSRTAGFKHCFGLEHCMS